MSGPSGLPSASGPSGVGGLPPGGPSVSGRLGGHSVAPLSPTDKGKGRATDPLTLTARPRASSGAAGSGPPPLPPNPLTLTAVPRRSSDAAGPSPPPAQTAAAAQRVADYTLGHVLSAHAEAFDVSQRRIADPTLSVGPPPGVFVDRDKGGKALQATDKVATGVFYGQRAVRLEARPVRMGEEALVLQNRLNVLRGEVRHGEARLHRLEQKVTEAVETHARCAVVWNQQQPGDFRQPFEDYLRSTLKLNEQKITELMATWGAAYLDEQITTSADITQKAAALQANPFDPLTIAIEEIRKEGHVQQEVEKNLDRTEAQLLEQLKRTEEALTKSIEKETDPSKKADLQGELDALEESRNAYKTQWDISHDTSKSPAERQQARSEMLRILGDLPLSARPLTLGERMDAAAAKLSPSSLWEGKETLLPVPPPSDLETKLGYNPKNEASMIAFVKAHEKDLIASGGYYLLPQEHEDAKGSFLFVIKEGPNITRVRSIQLFHTKDGKSVTDKTLKHRAMHAYCLQYALAEKSLPEARDDMLKKWPDPQPTPEALLDLMKSHMTVVMDFRNKQSRLYFGWDPKKSPKSFLSGFQGFVCKWEEDMVRNMTSVMEGKLDDKLSTDKPFAQKTPPPPFPFPPPPAPPPPPSIP